MLIDPEHTPRTPRRVIVAGMCFRIRDRQVTALLPTRSAVVDVHALELRSR